jgi:hypothetical protein
MPDKIKKLLNELKAWCDQEHGRRVQIPKIAGVSPQAVITVCGAQFYFWGRVGYLLAAAAGFSLVRSVVFWNAAVIGVMLFLIPILQPGG